MRFAATKENETSYQAIVAARDSLRNREEAQNMRGEMKKLDDETNDLTMKNNEERLTIQELENELIKRRRRTEKCRRLAEAQCSYRNTLEKMIRDAMHQSVVYKEQVRLNQAASNALKARLEAQKSICDGSERELHKKFKEREELMNQVRPGLEKARKRSRLLMNDEEDDIDCKLLSLQKELRGYFEEEHIAEASEPEIEEVEEGQKNPEVDEKKSLVEEGKIGSRSFKAFSVNKEPESDDDDESRRERGKGNVEKWLQILLEKNSKTDLEDLQVEGSKKIDEPIEKLDHKFPIIEDEELQAEEAKKNISKAEKRADSSRRSRMSFDLKNTPEKSGREKVVKRSESARSFRRIPSSPSLILKKGIDCIRKKPVVSRHDDDSEYLVKNNFIKSSLQTIKRAVKF